MSPLISLIAPVYKVEPYLREALDSAVNQTYRNLEIILVDDGSPDNCGKICDEYAAKDSRINVIHQKNAGSGMARNAGLDAAHGEYIIFFDPDDVMDLDLIDYLYTLRVYYPQATCITAVLRESTALTPKKVTEKITLFTDVLNESFDSFRYGPVAKLFTRKSIADLRFQPYYRGQDALFCVQYASKNKTQVDSTLQKYLYRIHPDAVTKRLFSEKDYDLLEVHLKIIDIIRESAPNQLEYAIKQYCLVLRSLCFEKIVNVPIRKGAFCKLKNYIEKVRSNKQWRIIFMQSCPISRYFRTIVRLLLHVPLFTLPFLFLLIRILPKPYLKNHQA